MTGAGVLLQPYVCKVHSFTGCGKHYGVPLGHDGAAPNLPNYATTCLEPGDAGMCLCDLGRDTRTLNRDCSRSNSSHLVEPCDN